MTNDATRLERIKERAGEKASGVRSELHGKTQKVKARARAKAEALDRDDVRRAAGSVRDRMAEVEFDDPEPHTTAQRAEGAARMGAPIDASLEPVTSPERADQFATITDVGPRDEPSRADEGFGDPMDMTGLGEGAMHVDDLVTGGDAEPVDDAVEMEGFDFGFDDDFFDFGGER